VSDLIIAPSMNGPVWQQSNLFGNGFLQRARAFQKEHPELEVRPSVVVSLQPAEGKEVGRYDLQQDLIQLGKQFDVNCHEFAGNHIAYA
jgi:hypothetical protein